MVEGWELTGGWNSHSGTSVVEFRMKDLMNPNTLQGEKTFKSSKGFDCKYKFTGQEKVGDKIMVGVGPIWSHDDYCKRKAEWEH